MTDKALYIVILRSLKAIVHALEQYGRDKGWVAGYDQKAAPRGAERQESVHH